MVPEPEEGEIFFIVRYIDKTLDTVRIMPQDIEAAANHPDVEQLVQLGTTMPNFLLNRDLLFS